MEDSLIWEKLKALYKPDCFAFWTDELTHTFKHDKFTEDNLYGNGCAGPAGERCPVCNPKKWD